MEPESRWIHGTVVNINRSRWNRVVGSSFQIIRQVVDSWNCRQYHSVPVEPIGRFQFSDHATSRWIHRPIVNIARFRWNRVVGSSFQIRIKSNSHSPTHCLTLRRVHRFYIPLRETRRVSGRGLRTTSHDALCNHVWLNS